MKVSGALAILLAIKDHGVETMFGYPGAANTPIFDELSKFEDIKHILVRHEQAAANAASGYSKVTGKVGVCTATSGPGATNLITGIATAYADSVPMIAITGQVNTNLIGKDAFQEADITGATNPFSKHNYLVKDARDIPRIMYEAFYIASTGRPGPVVIDIPLDVQQQIFEYKIPKQLNLPGYKPTLKGHIMQIKRAAAAINKAKRPLILAGGGAVNEGAPRELLKFVNKTNIPVVTTMMALGAIDTEHELNLGMPGSHGVKAANRALLSCDTLIVIGARIGDRTLSNTNTVTDKGTTVIHIDVDPAEIGKNMEVTIPVVGGAEDVLSQLNELDYNIKFDTAWIEDLKAIKNEKKERTEKDGYINPRYVIDVINKITNGDAIISTEVGQNQIWAANNTHIKDANMFLTSGGLGTMGYGLPAAIGAALGREDKTVFAIEGDGSFQMCLSEMATMQQWGAKVKIILFNNSRLGMVREYQKNNYKSNYFGVFLDGNPDFVALANAYGIKAERISDTKDVERAVKDAYGYDGSYLIDFTVDPMEDTL